MKYLVFILSMFILVGCSEEPTKKKTAEVTITITPKPKRKYVEQLCPKCNGTGSVSMTTGQKAGLALVTLGMGLLCDETECEKCRGKGIIKIPVPNKELIEE